MDIDDQGLTRGPSLWPIVGSNNSISSWGTSPSK